MPSLIPALTPITLFNGIAIWATGSFVSWLTVAFLAIGILLGSLILSALLHFFVYGFESLVYGPHHMNSEREDRNALRAITLNRRFQRIMSGRVSIPAMSNL